MPLIAEQEVDISKTIPQNFMASVERFAKEPFLAHRAGLSTNTKLLTEQFTKITFEESLVLVERISRLL